MFDISTSDGIVTIRFAHGKVSAFDLELVEGLARVIAEADANDARAIILTGTGSSFSAGVDLYRLVNGGREYLLRMYPALSRMFLDLFALQRPVVAAVNGHAIAGGCILASCADIRLMASGTGRIGVPEMLVGVPFPPAILEILRFAFPPQSLQALVYSGRAVQPDEALRMGIIDEIVEPEALLARAMEHARHLASLPKFAFATAKRQIRDVPLRRARRYSNDFDDVIMETWYADETMARVRDYLDRTVHRK